MLARPFLLQKRQACVMWWQQRLPVLSEHVSMPLNSFNQVNVATYNVMQPLVLVTRKMFHFPSISWYSGFFFFKFNQAIIHGKLLSKYCCTDMLESRKSDFILRLTPSWCLYSSCSEGPARFTLNCVIYGYALIKTTLLKCKISNLLGTTLNSHGNCAFCWPESFAELLQQQFQVCSFLSGR